MTHNIIKTKNYLLVVDDSEIKAGDFYLLIPENIVKLSRSGLPIKIREWAKIIAHLPLNNSPVLEGVPLLPPLEDDEAICPYPEEKQNAIDWHNGYNKAKEKYKYTEEDMRKALSESFKASQDGYNITSDEIIKSLQQPKMPAKMPVAFECEIFEAKDLKSVDEDWRKLGKPKTTTNPQGQTVLVGKYIY